MSPRSCEHEGVLRRVRVRHRPPLEQTIMEGFNPRTKTLRIRLCPHKILPQPLAYTKIGHEHTWEYNFLSVNAYLQHSLNRPSFFSPFGGGAGAGGCWIFWIFFLHMEFPIGSPICLFPIASHFCPIWLASHCCALGPYTYCWANIGTYFSIFGVSICVLGSLHFQNFFFLAMGKLKRLGAKLKT